MSSSNYIAHYKAAVSAIGEFDARELRGCTVAEIQALESLVGARLPEAFRQFLSFSGRGLAYFHPYPQFGYYSLLMIHQDLEDFLDEVHEAPMQDRFPADGLVVAEADGDQFWFVRCGEGENPPVWYWDADEERKHFDQAFPSVTAFLQDVFDNSGRVHAALLAETPGIAPAFYRLRGGVLDVLDMLHNLRDQADAAQMGLVQNALSNYARRMYEIFRGYQTNPMDKQAHIDAVYQPVGIERLGLPGHWEAQILGQMEKMKREVEKIYDIKFQLALK